ncbi:MAG: hypothetical protein V8T10_09570 [Merdibacter sp.]
MRPRSITVRRSQMQSTSALSIWAGRDPRSNSLEYFLKETCQMDVQISSALLGTEGHAFVDEKIDCGNIDSYIFSSQANADIMRIHNRNGNIWRRIYEIIFTAKERSLLRFCLDEKGEPDFVYLREEVRDPQIIDAMQQGILDFVHDYHADPAPPGRGSADRSAPEMLIGRCFASCMKQTTTCGCFRNLRCASSPAMCLDSARRRSGMSS